MVNGGRVQATKSGRKMRRLMFAVAALTAATMLMGQSARAGEGFRLFRGDHRLIVPGIAVGVATTGAYFAIRNQGGGVKRFSRAGAFGLSTVGCMALTPIVSGIVVQREMTRREVHVMLANCVVPFIGGWLMDAYFDRHPERDSVPPVVRVASHHRGY
jgi:hypothetical protein